MSIVAFDSVMAGESLLQRTVQVGVVLQCDDVDLRAGHHRLHLHLPQKRNCLAAMAERCRALWSEQRQNGHADLLISCDSIRHLSCHHRARQHHNWLEKRVEGREDGQRIGTNYQVFHVATFEDVQHVHSPCRQRSCSQARERSSSRAFAWFGELHISRHKQVSEHFWMHGYSRCVVALWLCGPHRPSGTEMQVVLMLLHAPSLEIQASYVRWKVPRCDC
jgi:hypothetical protein